MPTQPPLPESPGMAGVVSEDVKAEPPHPVEEQAPIPESSEEILTYEDQEFYVKDVAVDDVTLDDVAMEDVSVSVKDVDTSSPSNSLPVSYASIVM